MDNARRTISISPLATRPRRGSRSGDDRCSRGAGTLVINETRESMFATQKLSPIEFARASRSLTGAAREQFADLTHRLLLGVLEKLPRTSGSWFPSEVNTGASRPG